MIDFIRFRKRYGNREILSIDEVSFPPGIHWIKGENGTGKTSLFKCLAGILPFEGSIILHQNIDSKRDPLAFRKRMGYSEAEPIYPNFLTGADLVRFVGKAKNSPTHEQHDLAKKLKIEEYFLQPCATYSSGMTKKLSLVLCFLGNPDVIILDEPLTTIDTQTKKILVDLMVSSYEKGASFFISSHHHLEMENVPYTHQYIIQNQTLAAS